MSEPGRFSKLEFNVGKQKSSECQPQYKTGSGVQPQHFVANIRGEQDYLQQAQSQFLAGEHEKALRSYSAALGENPLCVAAWVGQIVMLVELGEYPEAAMWSDKAMEKFPDHPQLLSIKSIACFRMGKIPEARGLNDVALQAKGEYPLVWVCRGELMLEGHQQTAEQCFQHALKLPDCNRGIVLLNIGAVCLLYRKYCLAISYLQQATVSQPNAAWAWYLLGKTQVELCQYSPARVSFNQARILMPKHPQYLNAEQQIPRGGWQPLWKKLRRLFWND